MEREEPYDLVSYSAATLAAATTDDKMVYIEKIGTVERVCKGYLFAGC